MKNRIFLSLFGVALACSVVAVPTLSHAKGNTATYGQACTSDSDCSSGESCLAASSGSGKTCQLTSTQTATTGSTGNATGFVPLAPIPGLTSAQSNVTASTLANFLNNLYLYLIGAAATLAVIMIIWGGLEIATQDSVSKQGAGRNKIQQALFGLVLVLSPFLVFSIINPAILNLSIALPPLDTKTPTSSNSGATNATTTVQHSDNGIVTNVTSNDFFKDATFSATLVAKNMDQLLNDAATQWVATNSSASMSCAVMKTSECTGYLNGACQASPAGASCGLKNSTSFLFVDVTASAISNALFQYTLKPAATDGQQFMSACVSAGGVACAPDGVAATTLSKQCPSFNFTLPSGSPNAADGGKCYDIVPQCYKKGFSCPSSNTSLVN